jgi:hypothetical protein
LRAFLGPSYSNPVGYGDLSKDDPVEDAVIDRVGANAFRFQVSDLRLVDTAREPGEAHAEAKRQEIEERLGTGIGEQVRAFDPADEAVGGLPPRAEGTAPRRVVGVPQDDEPAATAVMCQPQPVLVHDKVALVDPVPDAVPKRLEPDDGIEDERCVRMRACRGQADRAGDGRRGTGEHDVAWLDAVTRRLRAEATARGLIAPQLAFTLEALVTGVDSWISRSSRNCRRPHWSWSRIIASRLSRERT